MSSDIKLSSFKGFKVDVKYEKIVDKFGDDTAKYLVRTSPRGNRRNKTYAQGWEFKVDEKKTNSYGGKVWNATNYQLTHLLENGHLIVNKRGGVGWASPIPHIDPAYQRVRKPFVEAMQKVEIEIK